MNKRIFATVAGLVLTLVFTQLLGAVIAQSRENQGSHGDPLDEGRNTLAGYAETNRKLSECMHAKGLPFDAGLAKSDVKDAFSNLPRDRLNKKANAEIDETLKNAADDPNAPIVAEMKSKDLERWSDAVNECSAQIDLEASGGLEGRAQMEMQMSAAKSSPPLVNASRSYTSCMAEKGFTVDPDPSIAPEAIQKAEHRGNQGSRDLKDRYDAAWKICVQPYQEEMDRKLFGN